MDRARLRSIQLDLLEAMEMIYVHVPCDIKCSRRGGDVVYFKKVESSFSGKRKPDIGGE